MLYAYSYTKQLQNLDKNIYKFVDYHFYYLFHHDLGNLGNFHPHQIINCMKHNFIKSENINSESLPLIHMVRRLRDLTQPKTYQDLNSF